MSLANRPFLEDELIVNEAILGRCNHRQWMKFYDEYHQQLLVCDECAEEFTYVEDTRSAEVPELSPDEFLRLAVRPNSQDELLANLALRRIESAGWRVLVTNQLDRFVCDLSFGTIAFKSRPRPARAEAICEAAALLARSSSFKPGVQA